jgi:elastin
MLGGIRGIIPGGIIPGGIIPGGIIPGGIIPGGIIPGGIPGGGPRMKFIGLGGGIPSLGGIPTFE